MKLYYQSGTCSLSPRIALEEAGIPYEAVRVTNQKMGDPEGQRLPDGSDFRAVNPLSYVPVLELDDGRRLFENPAIVLYIADLVPEKQLAPQDSFGHSKVLERLCFIGSELHMGFTPLFMDVPDAVKTSARGHLRHRFSWLNQELQGRDYQFDTQLLIEERDTTGNLLGHHYQSGPGFTVADGYLFTVLSWTEFAQVDLSGLTNLLAFRARMAARPAVQRALALENQ